MDVTSRYDRIAIRWHDPEGPSAPRKIVEDYQRLGFALVRLRRGRNWSEKRAAWLAERLGLGSPFVPIQYAQRRSSFGLLGFNCIRFRSGGRHQGFESRGAQALHCDGTLERIGAVPTSVLLCRSPGQRGGRTLVFDAAGAWASLSKMDPSAALALLDPRSLTRRDVGGTGRAVRGPAIAVVGQRVLSRFSVDNTSDWSSGLARVPNLSRGREAMLQLARDGSPHYLEVRLGAGDGIILANDRVAHGRSSYSDSSQRRRVMLRGLFRARPKCG